MVSNPEKPISQEDSLKSIDQISVVDPRNQHVDINAWHTRIANITLNDSTPYKVRQLFENAKNIALYAYFSYRLHQAAEAIGFIALEKALKLKFEQEQDSINYQREPKKLMQYMNIAIEKGWITDEGYESLRPIAESRVQERKLYELIKNGDFGDDSSIPIPEPEEDEIFAEMRSMEIAQKCLHAGRHVRNQLAHGEGGLSPSSIGTLNSIAEEINQLFEQLGK